MPPESFIAASSDATANTTTKFDKLLDSVEDVDDNLEYIQEIFEISNNTIRELLCNSLLHYFYLPVIVGSLAGGEKEYQVSVNTALFVLNKTMQMIKFEPLINTICIALLAKEGPVRILDPVLRVNNFDLLAAPCTFTPRWRYKLPS